MLINAKITGISYKPLLCKKLPLYDKMKLEQALNTEAAFLLNVDKKSIAVSTWVSPKRTRSYPFSRVYDTLSHGGKKVAIIPFVKDEGIDGDRDFIQWDTISLMSLLGVNVIIAYYSEATKNLRYKNKITKQRFDTSYIYKKIESLLSYQSDALHWNIEEINSISKIAQHAKEHYEKIENKMNVKLHSSEGIEKRIKLLTKDKNDFMLMSRNNSKSAQIRETRTIQPKENVTKGIKAQINIRNYLGGVYYFTCDEVFINENTVFIIEAKHTKDNIFPSITDIKDGLLKMILYTNLKDVNINERVYNSKSVLKLTAKNMDSCEASSVYMDSNKEPFINALIEEVKTNNITLYLPFRGKNA